MQPHVSNETVGSGIELVQPEEAIAVRIVFVALWVTLFAYSLGPKRLEVLRELIPNAKLIAVLANPANIPALSDTRDVEAAARAAGQHIAILTATSERDFEPAFAAMVQQRAGALLVMADPYFNSRRDQIVALAARHAIPRNLRMARVRHGRRPHELW